MLCSLLILNVEHVFIMWNIFIFFKNVVDKVKINPENCLLFVFYLFCFLFSFCSKFIWNFFFVYSCLLQKFLNNMHYSGLLQMEYWSFSKCLQNRSCKFFQQYKNTLPFLEVQKFYGVLKSFHWLILIISAKFGKINCYIWFLIISIPDDKMDVHILFFII